MPARVCRFCAAPLDESVCDLGMQPPSNAFITSESLEKMECFYPLHAFVCGACFLVQLEEFESPTDIFTEYAYYSSFSSTWLKRAERFAETMTKRLGLDEESLVIEIGSNDGYLLQYFKLGAIPVLGIDPSQNCAEAASTRNVTTLVDFFGTRVAGKLVSEGQRASLLVANNVLAHAPDLNDFVAGIALILAPGGTATVEVPHLLRLIERTEYDTIYHEHFSYFSLTTAQKVFAAQNLTIADVEEIPTHGGSIRMWIRHTGSVSASSHVEEIVSRERAAGLTSLETYRRFSQAVLASKLSFWQFLIDAKRRGKTVAAYGAAAKGNTLLNYCGVRSDLVSYVVDRNPYKQHRFLPGSHIPVLPVEVVVKTKPDYLLILPWNISDEVVAEMSVIRDWGGRFVTAIPDVKEF